MSADLECLPRQALKEYLAGWSDPEQSDWIESHLAECQDCEETIVALEANPDTLMELVRTASPTSASAYSENDSAIAAAISRSRDLFSASPSDAHSSRSSWEPPSQDIGAYELLEPLGHGGMGSVFLAKHRSLGKQVAIKLLPARTLRNDHFAARFQREVRAAGGLDHPVIVRATDAGEYQGTQYLVMEHIDGLDLSRIAKATGPLSIADACEIVRKVALGLSHAHAQGVVHRDIKPSNLMLSKDGAVKILDFGLARLGPWDEVSAELTTVGQLMGTLDYMAPEQAERAESVDYRADLYSLGATLFRLLCGRPPLAASPDLSPLAKLRLLATHEPPSLETLRSDAAKELVELVKLLLARDPASRPASAAHVAEALIPFGQDAQLVELVSQAKAADNQEVATEFSYDTLPKLPEDLSAQSDRSGSRGIGKWIAVCLLLPAMILAGVLITLETQKGQLVIRSDAEVSVRLQKDGAEYRELKIVPGVNTTRLYAGKYEVEIEGGSDQVSIDETSFIISSGETELASISYVKSSQENDSSLALQSLPGSRTKLKPGDQLLVKSAIDANLDFTVSVAQDLTVRLPMIGVIDATDDTTTTFEKKLNAEYGKLISNPSIDVFRAEVTRLGKIDTKEIQNRGAVLPPSTAKLKPGDALLFWSLIEDKLSARVIVQADETIKVPWIGVVSTQGATVSDLQAKLEQEYGTRLRNPSIQLFRDPTLVFPDGGAAKSARVASTPEWLRSYIDKQKEEPPTPVVAEPLYEGSPLSKWLETFALERSPKSVGAAISAIRSLLAPETSKVITNDVLATMPSLDGDARVVFQTNSRDPSGRLVPDVNTSTIDRAAFELLAEANPDGRYGQVLAEEFEEANVQWRKRLIGSGMSYCDLEDLKPLADWTEKATLPTDDLENIVQYFIGWNSSGEIDSEFRSELEKGIFASEKLGQEFWLSHFPKQRYDSKAFTTRLIAPHALKAFHSEETKPDLVIQATEILSSALEMDVLTEEQKQDLAVRAGARLKTSINKDLTRLVSVGDQFDELVPNYEPTRVTVSSSRSRQVRSSRSGTLTINMRGGRDSIANVTNRLLFLCVRLKIDVTDVCQEIASRTQEAHTLVDEVIKSNRGTVTLDWPALSISMNGWSSNGYPSQVKFKPDEWMAYFLYKQAAGLLPQEEQAEASQTPMAGRPSSSRGMSSSEMQQYLRSRQASRNEVLFNGRPLTEWLRILPLEKSSSGIKDALTALRSLTSDKTRERIVESLHETLPKMNDWDSASSYNGFRTLRAADLDGYYGFISKQLNESKDEQWKQRILKSGLFQDSEWSRFKPIHEWIVENAMGKDSLLKEAAQSFYVKVGKAKPLTPTAQTESRMSPAPFVEVIAKNELLTEAYWMDSVLSRTQPSPEWVEEVARRAKLTLADLKTDSDTYLRAALAAQSVLSDQGAGTSTESYSLQFDRKWFDDQLLARLKFLAENDRLLDRTNELLGTNNPLSLTRFSRGGSTKKYPRVESFEILELLESRDVEVIKSREPLINQIAEKVVEQAAELLLQIHSERDFTAARNISLVGDPGQLNYFNAGRQISSYKRNIDWSNYTEAQILSWKLYGLCRSAVVDSQTLEKQFSKKTRELAITRAFKKADKNSDKSIDSDEFKSILNTSLLSGREHSEVADKDGGIRLDDLFKLEPKKVQPANVRGGSTTPNVYRQWAEKNIEKYDRNGNGTLEKNEWEKMIIKPNGADANRDGVLTVEEYAKYRSSKKR